MSLALHSLFTQHAVLQRGKAVPVWGTAEPKTHIAVAIANREISTMADRNGSWKAWIEPLEAGGPHLLRITSETGESVEIRDVLIGDVYLCSRQSNMEWRVAVANTAAAECAAADSSAEPSLPGSQKNCRRAAARRAGFLGGLLSRKPSPNFRPSATS